MKYVGIITHDIFSIIFSVCITEMTSNWLKVFKFNCTRVLSGQECRLSWRGGLCRILVSVIAQIFSRGPLNHSSLGFDLHSPSCSPLSQSNLPQWQLLRRALELQPSSSGSSQFTGTTLSKTLISCPFLPELLQWDSKKVKPAVTSSNPIPDPELLGNNQCLMNFLLCPLAIQC